MSPVRPIQKPGIGITLFLDGKPLGISQVCTNELNSHKALVPVMIPASLTFGKHPVELDVASDPTVTDENDNFNVVLIY